MLWRLTWKDRVVIIRVGKIIRDPPWEISMESRYMIESPRTEVQECVHTELDEVEVDEKIIHTRTPLPSTFFINRESRRESLNHYKLAFQVPGRESRVYFRQGADIPCLKRDMVGSVFRDCVDLSSVEELMVMALHMRFHYPGAYIFNMPKLVKQQTTHWFHDITGARVEDVMAVCPKIRWVYWPGNLRFEVDPWELRNRRDDEHEPAMWTEYLDMAA